MSKKHLKLSQVAEQKGVSLSAVYKAIAQKRLKFELVLGKMAVRRSEAEAWQPKQRTGRRAGSKMSAEAKARISAGQKKRWAARRGDKEN